MKNERRLFIIILSLFLFVVGFVNAVDCGGTIQCQCGDTLVESQVMWYDLVDCPEHGLIIGENETILDCNSHTIRGVGNGDGISLNSKQGINVENCIVDNFSFGIIFDYSDNNNVSYNDIIFNHFGIQISYSNDNTFSNNVVSDSDEPGIVSYSSFNNIFFTNIIINNFYGNGIWFGQDSRNNIVWNNTFANNSVNAYEWYNSDNYWNTTIGNYWDDFEDNVGFPDYYEIPGSGLGVDWHPIWTTLEERILILEQQVANLTERVISLEESQEEQNERLDLLEISVNEVIGVLDNFMEEITSYLTFTPFDFRKGMICKYMRENSLTNYTALGLQCELFEDCRCQSI